MTNRIGWEFTHFISLSLGYEHELKEIEKYQETLKCISGIGERKKKEKMHVTMLCISAGPDEVAEIEHGFQRPGDKFSHITG